jgi:hypothetical protein
MKPGKTSETPAAPKSRFRTRYRLLITLAVLFIVIVFVFPLVFKPSVEPPANLQFASPFALNVQISNHNMTPLVDVEYTCEPAQLALATGSPAQDAKVVVRGSIKKLPGRKGIRATCETGYIPNAALKSLQYKMVLTYRPYPWQQQHTSTYLLTAQVDNRGQVTAWKVQ